VDTSVWIEFKDGGGDHVHVDDVLIVEASLDNIRCNVCFDYRDKEGIWGYMNRSELKNIEKYREEIIEWCPDCRVSARDIRRSKEMHEFYMSLKPSDELTNS
jgi:hypothetical protein